MVKLKFVAVNIKTPGPEVHKFFQDSRS